MQHYKYMPSNVPESSHLKNWSIKNIETTHESDKYQTNKTNRFISPKDRREEPVSLITFNPTTQRRTIHVNSREKHQEATFSPKSHQQSANFTDLGRNFNKYMDQSSCRLSRKDSANQPKSPISPSSQKNVYTFKPSVLNQVSSEKNLHVQAVMNSIKSRQKLVSPHQKRAQSPGSVRLDKCEAQSTQQRKQSENLSTKNKSPQLSSKTSLNQEALSCRRFKQQQQSVAFLKKVTSPDRMLIKQPSIIQNDDNSSKYSNTLRHGKTGVTPINIVKVIKKPNINTSFESTMTISTTRVCSFIFGKVIGNGKFGQVYAAKHKKTGFLVAIKKLHKSKIKQYNMEKQLLEEIKLQAFSSHPNIVNLYGLFCDTNYIYLILEYMEGGTLFQFLHYYKKLPERQVAIIMKEIGMAVKYLHQNQIAHRDIKPENIVFSLGIAKLCDFGWSARVLNKRKTYCGTFDYAPPEILEHKQYDEAVDLWCLGILMYQLLTGKVPFQHKEKTILMNRIINVDKEKILYPNFISDVAVDVIDRLLRKKPEQRIKITELLEHCFFRSHD